MSRPNVETVERVYALAAEDWAARDEDARAGPARLAELFDPNVVVQERADFPDSDTYRGYAGLVRWWAGFFEIYEHVRLEPQELIPHGDRVVVRVRLVLRSKGGVPLEQEAGHVWTLRDGRVVHVTGYPDMSQALETVRAGR